MDNENDVVTRGNYVFFWGGWPSQWAPAKFVLDDVPYNCAEQYMMAEKARLFGDEDRLRKILASDSPRGQKEHGRRVAGFVADKWNAVCRDVVVRGNVAKFGQNRELRTLLMATEERTLVEASPYDNIWGIGLNITNALATPPEKWPGKNWLGLSLMEARRLLRSLSVV